jgi:adhesin/invasin
MVHRLTIAILCALLIACDNLPLLAPTGSTITLSSTHLVLPSDGAAEITATVIEGSATPVHNGTLVVFNTTVGQLDLREARTHNGSATVRLRATGASGTARVTATSGGATAEAIEILIGTAAADTVSLSASPATVSASGGTVTLIATVRDAGGRGLPAVPVSFAASAGDLSAATAITDANGEARVSLTLTQEATVTARAGSKESSAVTVRVRTAVGVTVSVTPASPTEDVPATISLTPSPAGTVLRSVRVDFGDGSAVDLGTVTAATNVQHVYTSDGMYVLRVTATDPAGESVSSSTTIVVQPPAPIDVSIEAPSPDPPVAGVVTTFTATVSPSTLSGLTFRWDFGDGGRTTVTSKSTTHTYKVSGPQRVLVTVTSQAGGRGNARRDIVVQ